MISSCEEDKVTMLGGSVPPFLFKYYSLDGVVKTLSTNTLKWELPCDENDPFEALAAGWNKNSIRRAFPDDDQDAMVSCSDARFKSDGVQEKISHVAAYLSFSRVCDDILMWSHYAESNTGACIEFNVARLGDIATNLQKVKYAPNVADVRKRLPPISDDFNEEIQYQIREFLSYKAKEWKYEQEWRSIIPPLAKCILSRRVDDGKFILVSTIPDGAIKRVIFGHRMPVSTRIALAKFAKDKHTGCAFAEINPDRDRYKLNAENLGMEVYSQKTSVIAVNNPQ